MSPQDNGAHDFTRDAANAVRIFRRTFPEFLATFEGLLDPLIRFFAHTFRLKINPDGLPRTVHLETASQQNLRCSIVNKLMVEFNSTEPIGFDRDYDHDIFTFVLYWYLKDKWAAAVREQIERYAPQTDLDSFAGFSYHPRPISKELRPSLFVYNPDHPDLGDIDPERNGLYYVGRRDWIDGQDVTDSESWVESDSDQYGTKPGEKDIGGEKCREWLRSQLETSR